MTMRRLHGSTRPRLQLVAVAGVLAGSVCLGGIGALLLHDGVPAVASAANPSGIDIAFAQHMSEHHAQAIVMADLVANNPDLAVASLAHAIRTAQLEELGRLQGFLSLWSAPALPGTVRSEPMPGMATSDQLQRLRTLRGEQQAVLFLELMLDHHRGGIEMAESAAHEASLSPVRSLAAKMAWDQQQESALMTRLLRTTRRSRGQP